MLIAFIGCDGSGKTTLAKKLISRLRGKGLQCEYGHQYEYFLSDTIGNFIRSKENKANSKGSKSRFEKNPEFYYELWPFFSWFNLLLNFLWYKTFGKDKVNISDRYIYDMLIGWEMEGRINSLSRWLLGNFPEPDVIFLLDASPKVLYTRRKEEYPNYNFCVRKRSKYLDFAKREGINIVNTEGEVEDTVGKVMEKLKPLF